MKYTVVSVIIIVMSLFSGLCSAAMVFNTEPVITTEEATQRYGTMLYTVKAVTTCKIEDISLDTVCFTKFYHLVGHSKKDQVLISVGHTTPTARELMIILGTYLLAIEEGI